MKVFAQPETNADFSLKNSDRPSLGPTKWRVPIHCRLCREKVEVLSNFRASEVECPNCGVKFTFDPSLEPLPVPGVRLRLADVLDAQHLDCWEQELSRSEPLGPRSSQRGRTHSLRLLVFWLASLVVVALGVVAVSSGNLAQ